MHLPVPTDFSDITSNPTWAKELEAAYGGDIDTVDLLPGLYAEDLPKGFAFSDTAFRIFILMASRRLNSDRFFTTDFTPEVYPTRDWSGSTRPPWSTCSVATRQSWRPTSTECRTRSRCGSGRQLSPRRRR